MSQHLENAVDALLNIPDERKPPWTDTAVEALQRQITTELSNAEMPAYLSAIVEMMVTLRPVGNSARETVDLMILHGKALEELSPLIVPLEASHTIGWPQASARIANYLAPAWVDMDSDQQFAAVQSMLEVCIVWLQQWWKANA